jgi:hypothetical protein
VVAGGDSKAGKLAGKNFGLVPTNILVFHLPHLPHPPHIFLLNCIFVAPTTDFPRICLKKEMKHILKIVNNVNIILRS